jgi:hypothetical protein
VATRRPRPERGVRWRGRARETSQAGFGRGPRSEAAARPSENPFFFYNKYFQIYFIVSKVNLKMKKRFSEFWPKIKVVQNFILYNFHVGHFSKFSIDFEFRI